MQLALSPSFLLAMRVRQRQSWAVRRRAVNKERSLLKSVRSCKRGNTINTLKAISISTQKLEMNRSIHDSSITNVEIYTWKFCPFCIRAKALLNEKRVRYTEYSIDGDNDARAKMSERAGGLRTVPQIFINGKSIGGCDDLYELEKDNKLNELLGIKN